MQRARVFKATEQASSEHVGDEHHGWFSPPDSIRNAQYPSEQTRQIPHASSQNMSLASPQSGAPQTWPFPGISGSPSLWHEQGPYLPHQHLQLQQADILEQRQQPRPSTFLPLATPQTSPVYNGGTSGPAVPNAFTPKSLLDGGSEGEPVIEDILRSLLAQQARNQEVQNQLLVASSTRRSLEARSLASPNYELGTIVNPLAALIQDRSFAPSKPAQAPTCCSVSSSKPDTSAGLGQLILCACGCYTPTGQCDSCAGKCEHRDPLLSYQKSGCCGDDNEDCDEALGSCCSGGTACACSGDTSGVPSCSGTCACCT